MGIIWGIWLRCGSLILKSNDVGDVALYGLIVETVHAYLADEHGDKVIDEAEQATATCGNQRVLDCRVIKRYHHEGDEKHDGVDGVFLFEGVIVIDDGLFVEQIVVKLLFCHSVGFEVGKTRFVSVISDDLPNPMLHVV